MKKILIAIVFMASSTLAFSQIQDAQEVIIARTVGKTNGYKIFVPKSNSKDLETRFKKWMKEYSAKVEKDKKSEESVVRDVKITSMSESIYTIYATYSTTSEGGYLNTFVQVGDVFVTANTHLKEATEWTRLLKKFATETTVSLIQEELDQAEKKLQGQSRDLEKLKKEQADYEKDIAACEAKIIERKSQLVTNAEAQLSAQKDVMNKTSEVDNVKNELKRYQP